MGKITGIAVLAAVTLAGAASARDVVVGAFYAPGMAIGPASEVNEINPVGFAGAFSLGVTGNWAVSFRGGYTEYTYREPPHVVPAIAGYAVFDEIPILTLTVGIDYGFPVSAFVPYVAGGAVWAFEFARYGYKTDVDVAPGLYAGAGVRYFIREDIAFEAGPRYTLLFDDPVVVYNGLWLERAEARSQLVDLLVGVNYRF
jgi:hypothetical protein